MCHTPVSAKLGMTSKVRMKFRYAGKNKGGIKLFLAGVSSPFLNLPYLHLL
jgi:hypothetical protein